MIRLADGSRGRIATFVNAAGEIFSGAGFIRGFVMSGPTNDVSIRDKAANGTIKIRLPNLAANATVYVMCDVAFNDGAYLTIAGGNIVMTVFHD